MHDNAISTKAFDTSFNGKTKLFKVQANRVVAGICEIDNIMMFCIERFVVLSYQIKKYI